MLQDLLEAGWWGTLAMAVLGGLCLFVAGYGVVTVERLYIWPAVIGGCLVLFSPMPVLIQWSDGRAARRPVRFRKARIDAEGLAVLSAHERPFWVCTECARECGGPQCAHCLRTLDVVYVETEDDLRLALVAMDA